MANVENSSSTSQFAAVYDVLSWLPGTGVALFPVTYMMERQRFANDIDLEAQRFKQLAISSVSTTAILALIVFLRLIFADDLGDATAEKAMCATAFGTTLISGHAAYRFARAGEPGKALIEGRHLLFKMGWSLTVIGLLCAFLILVTNDNKKNFNSPRGRFAERLFTGIACGGVGLHSLAGVYSLWQAHKKKEALKAEDEPQLPAAIAQIN